MRPPGRGEKLAAVLIFGPLALATLVAGALLLLDRTMPFPMAALERPFATVVTDRDGAPLRWYLAPDDKWRFPVELEALPAELETALMVVEDRRFRSHRGVDPLAVMRALRDNLRAGRVVSGASTLTMQIARMIDPAPRTLAAKLEESIRALQLERRFDKDELLELYLELAPYGGNLEGVVAASRAYFGKPPERLSLAEIALLVALPRSPVAYDPFRHPKAAKKARDGVLRRLAETGVADAAEARQAILSPLPSRPHRPPFEAPHFSDLARSRQGATSGPPGVFATTLDSRLQGLAERLARRRAEELRAAGIDQCAVVVLDLGGREVRALVGSIDFFDERRQGQVNGALARRSPGSTLKPFLYGLALDTGVIAPDSYLLDVPTDFAGYVAENYDGSYSGRVTAREALVRSLNAPAVRLLSRVGLRAFHELLLDGGLATLSRPSAAYGLPLVLGAGEVNLLDLTNLYASLALGGVHRAPALTPREDAGARSGDRLLSPEAAWVVTEILMGVERPDLPGTWSLARDVPAVAWKTGTSYGHRDAWAVGYSRDYAIGVWVGNFDGRSRQGISGSEHAAPLLFDLFRVVEPGGVAPSRPAGLALESIRVCALSHELAGLHCPELTTLTYLPGRTRLGPCEMHRRYRENHQGADPVAGWRSAVVYPSELEGWWRSEGRGTGRTEGRDRGRTALGEGPRILSPDAATPYRLRQGVPVEHQRIALTARVGAGVRRLYWFQDGLLVGSGRPEEPLFLDPRPGSHRLVVTDDLGRSDGTSILVE